MLLHCEADADQEANHPEATDDVVPRRPYHQCLAAERRCPCRDQHSEDPHDDQCQRSPLEESIEESRHPSLPLAAPDQPRNDAFEGMIGDDLGHVHSYSREGWQEAARPKFMDGPV
jgi:hypothetical protein